MGGGGVSEEGEDETNGCDGLHFGGDDGEGRGHIVAATGLLEDGEHEEGEEEGGDAVLD